LHGGTCLLLLALVGGGECANLDMTGHRVTLKFAAQVGNEEARCDQMFTGMGTTGENCEILDLRFFVSNIRLIACFLRTMIAGGSAFHREVYGGEDGAMSESAGRGAELFFSERLECHHCHGGFHFTQA
jgi:hypothetical protein